MIYLVLIAACSLFLGTANPLLHIPLICLGYPACLYLIAIHAKTAKSAFYYSWLAGSLASALCVYWLVIPVHVYGHFPLLLALPIPLVFGFIHGIYAALFTFLMYKIKDIKKIREYELILLSFFAWFFVEWLRSWFLTGFTWLNLVSANAAFPVLIQGVSLIGMQGLSAVFALIACALVAEDKKIKLCGVLFLICIVFLGYFRLDTDYMKKDVKTAHYALIQGNLLPEEKWNNKLQEESLKKYLTLSKKAIDLAKEKRVELDFIVFPETALPFFLQDNRYLSKIIMDFVDEYEIPIITGAVSYSKEKAQDTINTDIFNSVFLLSPDNIENSYDKMHESIEVVYSKQHLLPFGEYVPEFLSYPIFEIFFAGIGAFTPAKEQEILEYEGQKIGMLICYEAIFSYLAQEAVEKDAQILINLSNDAWYGKSAAAKQHLDISAIRAIEQDRYMLRATNTGITTAINPYGQVKNSPRLFTDAILVEKVGYRNHKTIFHKIEPILSYILNLIFLVFLCIVITRRSRQARKKR